MSKWIPKVTAILCASAALLQNAVGSEAGDFKGLDQDV